MVRAAPLRVVLGLAVALLVLVAPAAAPAAQKGVVTDMTWGVDQQTLDRTAAALADTGAQWTRINLPWRYGEPVEGTFDASMFAKVETAIALIRSAGSRVILTIEQPPEWASGSPDPRYPPTDPSDLARFVDYAATRLGATVDAWEIWNEPNHPHFWFPDPQADPNACAGYAQLLRAAYPVIKVRDPGAVVLFAGLAFADFPYVERCYAADPGIGTFFDAMALHPYAMGGKAPEAVVDSDPADGRQDAKTFLGYREVRRSMAERGDPKPIWLTEFGWSTATDGHELGNVTLDGQADYLTRAYKLLEQDDYVPVATWYSLRNVGADGIDWLSQLGLMWTNFTPKPAYGAFKAYVPPGGPGANAVTVPPADQRPAAARRKTAIRVTARRLKTPAGARRPGVRFRLSGSVTGGPRGGRVTLRIQRAGAKRRWRTTATLRTRLASRRFARIVRIPAGARWRVRASYAGTATYAASASKYAYLSTRIPARPR